MPMYLDRHEIEGATAEDVAVAHVRDLEVQHKYGVRYLTYWFDYNTGRAFCLTEAPSAQAAEAVHREAHGLVGSSIIEVDPAPVVSFLGPREAGRPPLPPPAPALAPPRASLSRTAMTCSAPPSSSPAASATARS